MKIVLKPSLEHRAFVKIIISLWNQNDVKDLILIEKLCFHSDSYFTNKYWKTIEETVIEKLSQLPLPKLLKEKALGFIEAIGSQIFEWIKFHCINFDLSLPAQFCWTQHGTIDRKKTAEVLVKDESLDLSTRYKLACIYCTEDDIKKFWNNMSEDLKESFVVLYKFPIIIFWSCNMKRRALGRFSYRSKFQHCASSGNKVATEYFLQKLNREERKLYLWKTAKSVEDADTFLFLMSEMNEEEQVGFFKYNSYKVLKCFLQWPFQSYFIRITNCMWDFLSKKDYDTLLVDIIQKAAGGYKDCNYKNLFREFWQKSPHVLKSFVTDEIDKCCALPFLFLIKDKENIRLILKGASLSAKEKLIYSYKMNDFCQRYICNNEWDFLEFLIRECLPSKDEMLKFKNAFEERAMHSWYKNHVAENKQKWDQLLCNYDKRHAEEDESSSSKQFKSFCNSNT